MKIRVKLDIANPGPQTEIVKTIKEWIRFANKQNNWRFKLIIQDDELLLQGKRLIYDVPQVRPPVNGFVNGRRYMLDNQLALEARRGVKVSDSFSSIFHPTAAIGEPPAPAAPSEDEPTVC